MPWNWPQAERGYSVRVHRKKVQMQFPHLERLTLFCQSARHLGISDAYIEIHVQGLEEDGLPIPEPSSVVDYLEISA
jgi:hypothetical protein